MEEDFEEKSSLQVILNFFSGLVRLKWQPLWYSLKFKLNGSLCDTAFKPLCAGWRRWIVLMMDMLMLVCYSMSITMFAFLYWWWHIWVQNCTLYVYVYGRILLVGLLLTAVSASIQCTVITDLKLNAFIPPFIESKHCKLN